MEGAITKKLATCLKVNEAHLEPEKPTPSDDTVINFQSLLVLDPNCVSLLAQKGLIQYVSAPPIKI